MSSKKWKAQFWFLVFVLSLLGRVEARAQTCPCGAKVKPDQPFCAPSESGAPQAACGPTTPQATKKPKPEPTEAQQGD